MIESTETNRQARAEMLARDARLKNKAHNLPRYAEGMTPRAFHVETQRAKNRAAVERSIKVAEEAERQGARPRAGP